MACYNKKIFKDKYLTTSVLCSDCHNVARDPLNDLQGHIYGKNCIKKLINSDCKCAVDGHDLRGSKLSYNESAIVYISNLEVSCTNFELCSWTGKVKHLETHLKEQCSFELFNCPNAGCNFSGFKDLLVEHDFKCESKKVVCVDCKKETSHRAINESKIAQENLVKPANKGCESNLKEKMKQIEMLANASVMQNQPHSLPLSFAVNLRLVNNIMRNIQERSAFLGEAHDGTDEEMVANAILLCKQVDLIKEDLTGGSNDRQKSASFVEWEAQNSDNENSIEQHSAGMHANDLVDVSNQSKTRIERLSDKLQNDPMPIDNLLSDGAKRDNKDPAIDMAGKQSESMPAIKRFLEPSHFSEFGFCKLLAGYGVRLISNKVARGSDRKGGLVLLDTPLERAKSCKYVIKYRKLTLAVGVCLKSIAVRNNYHLKSTQDGNHGCFLFRIDGQILVHGKKEGFTALKGKPFKLSPGDSVELELDRINHILFLRNCNEGSTISMILDSKLDYLDLYPCVLLYENQCIELVNQPSSNSFKTGFDLSANRIDLSISGSELTRWPFGDMLLVNASLIPGKDYKFRINQQSSHGIAIGVCNAFTVTKNNFNFEFTENHGCYLFHSSGVHFRNKFKLAYTRITPKVSFNMGDVISLCYDSGTFSLILTNITSGGESKMPLCISEDKLNFMYPCVWLYGEENEIELV